MLKKVLIAIVALVALFLIIAAVLPADYRLERSVTIDRPAEDIYPLVVNLPNWPKWDPFTEQDPEAELSFTGTPGTVGSSWSWKGEIIGTGNLTVQEFVPNQSIRSRMEFISPQAMIGRDIWAFNSTDSGTEVVWISEGDLDYPVNRVVGLFMESIIGPTIERGLANLKRVSESLPPPAPAQSDSTDTE